MLPALLSALSLGGCATVTVKTDSDPSAHLGKYHTYVLAPPPHGQSLSPTSEAALRAALRVSLSTRRIEEIPSGKPDLAVVRHIFRQGGLSPQEYASWGYGASWPFRDGHYAAWTGAPSAYMTASAYADGTLVLDFVDTKTRRLVFRGVGKGVVGSRESTARNIEDAVAKIVAAMPGR